MSNIQQYWKAVRVLAGSLPEFVWLVDAVQKKDAVVVTQAAAGIAAKLIYAKTHRVATDDEVEAHRAQELAASKEARRERLRRSGAAVVTVENDEEPATKTAAKSPGTSRRRSS